MVFRRRRPLSPEAQQSRHLNRGRRRHRRALWLIVGPVALVTLLTFLLPGLAMLAMSGRGSAAFAASMVACLLLPLLIVNFILYMVLISATFYTAKAYGKTSGWLHRLHRLTYGVNQWTHRRSEQMVRPMINTSARLAYFHRLFGGTPPSAAPKSTEDEQ